MWVKKELLFLGCLQLLVIVDGMSYLQRIDHYDTIEPLHIGTHARHKRDLSTKYDNNTHLDETTFRIVGLNKDFVIKVNKNTVLLPKSYVLYYQDEYGELNKMEKNVENCYYHGNIVGKIKSSVVLSTCDGLRGSIEDTDGETYFIEPTGNAGSHIFFNMKHLKQEKPTRCGMNHSDESNHHENHKDHLHTFKDHLRKRRATNVKKYIETVAVVDKKRFNDLGGTVGAAQQRAVELMNYVDEVYKTINTRVTLKSVVVFNVLDVSKVTTNVGETLSNFKEYTATVLHNKMKLYPDNAQLITGQGYGNVVGLAGVGVMCSLSSCGINSDHEANAAVSANTIAHEMGHNLGFYHRKSGCTCPAGPCVMEPSAPSSQVKSFSSCASATYSKLESEGEYPCLYDYPDTFFSKAECGNGYLEKGEACDCGTEKDCQKSGADKCCDYKTCTLRPSAKCADGECCENCQFKAQGALCRKKMHNECDLEEFCGGTSPECPRNSYVKAGRPCFNGEGICFKGLCKTHTAQCENLWGTTAEKALDACFRLNLEGDKYGNCGVDARDKELKCDAKDILCGKIQCQPKPGQSLPRSPVIGGYAAIKGQGIGGTVCRAVKLFGLSPELDDPTMTTEGTKCADNSICFENKCTNLSTFASVKSCEKPCQNGGICNNNGNCHCPSGWACPHCEQAGPGGSLDSGQGCLLQDDCECLTPLVKALLVVFLLVLPLCGFIGFLLFRNKDNLRSRWTVYRQSKRGRENETVSKTKFIGNKETGQMKTGIATSQPPSNPYASSSAHQSVPLRSAPGGKEARNVPTSGKMRAPPKIPPTGGASPGKLPQIAAFNKMDSNAAESGKLPPVKVKGGKNYR